MLTFAKLCHLMENQSHTSDDDNLAIEAIKKGLDLRSNTKEGQTFWDDFMRVTGNARALGHLLGVDPVHVMKWRARVKKYYDQVKSDRKSEEQNKQKRNKMVNTGDQPHPQNQPQQGPPKPAGNQF